MVERQLPKLDTRVRFPSPAKCLMARYLGQNSLGFRWIENESENSFADANYVYGCLFG